MPEKPHILQSSDIPSKLSEVQSENLSSYQAIRFSSLRNLILSVCDLISLVSHWRAYKVSRLRGMAQRLRRRLARAAGKGRGHDSVQWCSAGGARAAWAGGAPVGGRLAGDRLMHVFANSAYAKHLDFSNLNTDWRNSLHTTRNVLGFLGLLW